MNKGKIYFGYTMSRTGELRADKKAECAICGSGFKEKKKNVGVHICPSCRTELKRMKTEEEKDIFMAKSRYNSGSAIEYR